MAFEHRAGRPQYDQFILFGDSLTEQSSSQERGFAFAPALQDAYARRLDVIIRGFGGYNTRQALSILPNVPPAPEQAKMRFLMIFFGANDACSPVARNGQHVPLPEFKENLRSIVRHPSITVHQPRIILTTPAPVEERKWETTLRDLGYDTLNRFSEVASQYADVVREVGRELDVPVLDLWKAICAETKWKDGEPLPGSKTAERNKVLEELLYDGLHFAPAAYRVLYEELVKVIATHWPDQLPEKIPPVFPAWDDKEVWAKVGLDMGKDDVLEHS